MPTPQASPTCELCGRALISGSRFCNRCGAPAPGQPSDSVHVGDVLEGKWRVESVIGQGGMGTVYLTTNLTLGRKVAVKMLAAELCDDEKCVARFEREARLTATLDHPKVIVVYGVGRHVKRPFIVMKYLEGETLARRMARVHASGQLIPVGEVRSIAAQVCAGLGHIHERGLVHRDVKPSNVFLGPDLSATIIDFGILRDLNSTEKLTRAGKVMGTPQYLSPEQILGKKCDHRIDLYSLGVILFELLTGELPFDGANDTEVVQKQVREPPPDPHLINPALTPEVCTLLRRALAKDPAERPQSAGELALEIAHAFELDESPDPVAPTAPDLAPVSKDQPAVAERSLPRVSDETVPMRGLSDETVPMKGLPDETFPMEGLPDETVPMKGLPVEKTTTPLRPPPEERLTQEEALRAEPDRKRSEAPTAPMRPLPGPRPSAAPAPRAVPRASSSRMLWLGLGMGVALATVIWALVLSHVRAARQADAAMPASAGPKAAGPKKPPREPPPAEPAPEPEDAP